MHVFYKNPVWPRYFADPFVLKSGEWYYAYGTSGGPEEEEGAFVVLRSRNLVEWERLGCALRLLENPRARSYWAPEVLEEGGKFYMYYSASVTDSDEHHRIREAVAENPGGPFVDMGKVLLPELGFSIDASPFRDPKSGKWYLFFAKDFEADAPHGTGLAVVELGEDKMSVVGDIQSVVRASEAWQVYERNRQYKERVWEAWHCIEGPCVIYHKEKYYCLYSAGAWYGENYGVGYAVADSPMGPWRDEMARHGPTVLKGIAGKVLGPGHNSVVMGPDGKTLYMVYHAWDAARTARRMCIDPILWGESGPFVDGPSTEERKLDVGESSGGGGVRGA